MKTDTTLLIENFLLYYYYYTNKFKPGNCISIRSSLSHVCFRLPSAADPHKLNNKSIKNKLINIILSYDPHRSNLKTNCPHLSCFYFVEKCLYKKMLFS